MLPLAAWPLAAQSWDNSGNSMLSGTYYFREIYYFVDSSSGNIAESAVAYNNITFDGKGNYTGSATIVDSSQGAAAESIKGTYSIAASGYGFITDPFITGNNIYGLVSQQGIFIGSSTESDYNNLFIAAPIASPQPTNATLKGSYTIFNLDVTAALQYYYYYGQGDPYILGSTFQVNADGAGNLGSFAISGYYGGSGSSLYTQTATGIKYAFTNGAGSFTIPSSSNALTFGQKYLYVSPDANFIFGGGVYSANSNTSDPFDFFVGVRTGTGTPNLNGLYYQAGIDENDSGVTTYGYGLLDNYYGSFYASNGVLWEHERLIYENALLASYPTAYTYADTYSVPSSGAYTDPSGVMKYVVGAGGTARIGFGVGPYLGVSVALQAPSLSPSGVWINPQQVVNAASSAPFTAGISPGEFVTIYGSDLAPGAQTASSIPFPANLNGVTVNINGLAAPIYYVSPTQISALVPYATAGGSIATIQVNNGGTVSNTVTTPIDPGTPGVFTQTSTGVGAGSIQHSADYSLVTAQNPAQPGETVVVYLSGLGAVNPSVPDGSAAPTSPPYSSPTSTVFADITGTEATAAAFLVPGSAGLYQVNVTVPSGLTAGTNVLDIGTCPTSISSSDCFVNPESYTSEATIPVGSGASMTSVTPAQSGRRRKAQATWAPTRRRAGSVCDVRGGICPGKQ